MLKQDIFKDIVDVMDNDSSCKELNHYNALKIYNNITENMSDNEFLYIVNSYLNSYGLTGHLNFIKNDYTYLPFKVERYDNFLFITDANKDSNFNIGDKIISIDGYSIKEYAKHHNDFLFNESEERQGPHWERLLRYASKIICISHLDNKIYEQELKLTSNWSNCENYECKIINDEITYLRFNDFADEIALDCFYKENDKIISNSKNLIIDVRGNNGGSDSGYFKLLKYALPNGKRLNELDINEDVISKYGSETNYSKRNCDIRIKLFDSLLSQDIPLETKELILKMKKESIDKSGFGFCLDEEDMDISIIGDSKVEKIYIIADSKCKSTGDNFVYTFGKLDKVSIVGRNTMGILDYSNLSFVSYDEYTLIYPTSRLVASKNGNVMMKKGVKVDYYIRWTPEHIQTDKDLNYVLKIISG